MKYPAHDEKYITEYINWPTSLPRKCPACESPVKFVYKDNGKLVRTLTGNINQITSLYQCTNPECALSTKAFNPAPRFDFEGFHFGKDVVHKVMLLSIRHRLNAPQIKGVLEEDFGFSISENTIRKMIALATVVKAEAIDDHTREIMAKQKIILLGLDGEEPTMEGPSLWLFIDLLSNRLLHTAYLESAPSEVLHNEIEYILSEYGVSLIGVVSDKQNNIVKCMSTYYPDVPHQFCGMHFMQHLWSHMSLMDGRLFKQLNNTILKPSYFLNLKGKDPVYFEEHGPLLPSNVFAGVERDLKRMQRFTTVKFKKLRGLRLYETLMEYLKGFMPVIKKLPPNYRLSKIYRREVDKWKSALEAARSLYEEVSTLFQRFTLLYETFYSSEPASEIEGKMEAVFNEIEEELREEDPDFDPSALRSFLPASGSTYSEVCGEWLRLWYSYRHGLFSYASFPKAVKTNVACERAFSVQKRRLYGRTSRKNIGPLLYTEGDFILRFSFCTDEEWKGDLFEEAARFNWKILMARYSERKISMLTWLAKCERFLENASIGGELYCVD